MTYEEYCDFIRENFRPHHAWLYEFREDFFAPRLVRAVKDGRPAALRDIIREAHPQVYSFDMLRREFCNGLLEEADWFEQWCEEIGLPQLRPNTMNNYGTVLSSVGFNPFLDRLMKEYVAPFAALLYPDVGGDSLDSHHGFIVEYELGKDVSLDFHVDVSDVTLNVCLGKEFSGGTLFFRGIRCGLCQETAWRPEEELEIAHAPYGAILHRGKHRHGANPIAAGERHNLILWCNSSRFAREHDATRCTAWCGGRGKKG